MPDADATITTAWSTATPVAALPAANGRKFYLIQHHEIWDAPEDEVNATWRLPLRKIVISRWLEEIGTRIGATDIRHIPNGLDLGRFRVTAPSDRRPMSLYHHQAIKGVPDALAVLRRYHERFPHIPVSMFEVPPRGPDMPVWIDYFQEPTQDDLVARIYNKNAVYLGASLAEG